jgi:PST family polysaccharide transporter
MRNILKVTSTLGIATGVSIFAGLVRAKYLAWQLGPAGVGIVAQAIMLSSFVIQFCSLNINNGITKEVSEAIASGDADLVGRTVDTAALLQSCAAVMLAAASLVFTERLTEFVFSDRSYWPYFAGIVLTAPLAVALSGIAYPVFYGLRKVASCTRLAILNTLASLALVLPLVFFYKTKGMLLQIIAASIMSFALSYYFIRRDTPVRIRLDTAFFAKGRFRDISSRLFRFGLIGFIPANVNMFVLLYLRGLFMKQYGVDANGYFQVGYAMSAYYLPFITNSVWGHFYPQMCSLKEKRDINFELGQFVRFALFVATAIAAAFIIFRKYIIVALYSAQFMKAYDMLAVQAVGDIFFVIFYIFTASLTARRRFRDVILFSMLTYNGSMLAVFWLLRRSAACDIITLNAAIAGANAVLAIVAVAYWRLDTGFTLSRANLGLILKSALLLTAILLIPDVNLLSTAVKTVCAAAWFFFSVTRDEAKGILRLISSRMMIDTEKA